jgi:predicted nuclease of predicted toxin-antitoxin system
VKLLLDENLSDQIIHRIVDLYPDSEHVKTLGLINTDDAVIWEYAKVNGFVIVSKDSDFHQRSSPPHKVWGVCSWALALCPF